MTNGPAFTFPQNELTTYEHNSLNQLIRTVAPEKLANIDPHLRKAADRFSHSVVEVADAVEGSIRHHRKGIIERQFIHNRVADMAIDIYAMAATLSRTDGLIRKHGARALLFETKMCDLFVERAWRRVRRNARRVDFEADAPLSDIARAVYEREGYRVPGAWAP